QSLTYTITFDTTSGDDAAQPQSIDVTINGQEDAAVVTVSDVTDSEADVSTPVTFSIANQVSQTDADTQDAVQVDYVAGSGVLTSPVGAPVGGLSLNVATGEVSYDRGAFN